MFRGPYELKHDLERLALVAFQLHYKKRQGRDVDHSINPLLAVKQGAFSPWPYAVHHADEHHLNAAFVHGFVCAGLGLCELRVHRRVTCARVRT